MFKQSIILVFAALLVSACGTTTPPQTEKRAKPAPIEDRAQPSAKSLPGGGGYLAGDGPGANIPPNLDAIPDAVPVSEPLHRYANQPYVALGQTYTPITVPGRYKKRGIASWYGKKFHGQRTSSGEEYDMYAMTAAHTILPIPSYVRVTNVDNGKSVVVRINDRGPFLHDREIDLSYTAAHKLGIIGNGSSEVEVESLIAYAGTYSANPPAAVNSAPLAKAAPAPKPVYVALASSVAATGNAYLQLGAFGTREAAERYLVEMREKLGDIGKQLVLYSQDGHIKVHVGPYASPEEARSSREGLKNILGFMPMLSLH